MFIEIYYRVVALSKAQFREKLVTNGASILAGSLVLPKADKRRWSLPSTPLGTGVTRKEK
jgi:hypothetical protein